MKVIELVTLLGVPFHAQQIAAITAPAGAPLLVTAGAGAGKTTVMAARVVWLVGNGEVRPEQVLGLTFTNKAAASLAAKIRAALDLLAGRTADPGRPAAGTEVGEPDVSTYHAYAGRLVREHGLRVGVEPEARLLADATRFQLAGRVMRHYTGPLPGIRNEPQTVLKALVDLESSCSDHLVDPSEVRAADLARAERLTILAAQIGTGRGHKGRHDQVLKAAAVSRSRADICLLALAYRDAKRAGGMVDFGDQISTAVAIATGCAEAVASERDRSREVLLDEYQDTSVAQRLMLAALFGRGHGVTAVGDPFQAIYGWRGASVANLVGFPEHFGPDPDLEPAASRVPVQVLPLSVSQRNGGRLLTLANGMADGLRAAHPVEPLTAPEGREHVGSVRVARLERFADELRWITGEVKALVEAGTAPGEIAVLLRAWRHAGPVHAALSGAGLPVEVVGLGGLLSLPEVADVVAVLEVLDDATANAALVRLLAGPRWMLGGRDLRALGTLARRLAGGPQDQLDPLDEAARGADPCDVVALSDALEELAFGGHGGREAAHRNGGREAAHGNGGREAAHVNGGREAGHGNGGREAAHGLSPEGARRCAAMGRELRRLRRRAGDPLLDLVQRVIAVTGLEIEVAASPGALEARRREGLAAFVDVAASYTSLEGDSGLSGFLAYLRAAEEYDRGFDSALPSGGDAIQILTVHKAKGLEWDVVVLPDLTATVFPNEEVDRWPGAHGVLPTPHRQDAASLPADPDWDHPKGWAAYVAAGKRHQRLEEDRLGYVAVTRARNVVIASSHLWGPTQITPRQPSAYLLRMRDHAEAGFGELGPWVEDAVDGDRNPFLDGGAAPWPFDLEPQALGARVAAAQAVSAEMLAVPDVTERGWSALPTEAELAPGERERMADYDADIDALLAEALAERSTDVVVELPGGLTVSQVQLLRADPQSLARDLVRPMPRRPAPAARRGTAFHSWVEEHFALTPLLEPEELPGSADIGMDDEDLAALKTAFLATRWAGMRPHAIEAPFAILLGGRLVRGRIDAVYDLAAGAASGAAAAGQQAADGPRWHVIDWKTGTSASDPLQLALYRSAWATMAGCNDSEVLASFLTVRTGKLLTPPGLPDRATLDLWLAGSDAVSATG